MAKKTIAASKLNIDHTMVDQDALTVIEKLQKNGFAAHIVGGGVRDLLLGRKPKDYDIVTDAEPEKIRKIFSRNSLIIGRRFKLVHVIFERHDPVRSAKNGYPSFIKHVIEVSTYRSNKIQNQAVSEHLLNGRCIGFFPEGTVGDGDKLLPFKAPILESALIAKSSIIPVVIIYYRKDGTIAEEASFGKKYNLVQSVLNTLTLNGLIAKIFVLETVKAENFANRDQLTEHLYQQINAKFSNRQILFDEN